MVLNMNKLEYLVYCFNNRCYQRKTWLLSVFSMVSDTPKNKSLLDKSAFSLIRDSINKTLYFCYENGDKEFITDGDITKPLFTNDELITLLPEHHEFITEPTNTTVGIMLLNFSLFWVPFKGLVPYHNGEFTTGFLKQIISGVMVDNPKTDGEILPVGKASVDDCLKVTNQANFLAGCNNIFVKAAGVDALTVSKEVLALRDRLLSEHTPEQLKDPVTVAKIIDQIVAADFKEQMSGPSKTFFINKALIDNARKKMFLIFGMERDLNTGEYILISKPLSEGWDLNNLALYVNTSVMSAYDRGKSTGEGGAAVKEIIKLTSNIQITEEDCGNIVTESIQITKDSFKRWVGCYHLIDNKPVVISKDDSPLIGTYVKMRTVNYCQTKEGSVCRICCGDNLGSNPKGVSAEVVAISTVFMLLSMKSVHVSQLHTSTIDLSIALT